jgi:hypothetical protein
MARVLNQPRQQHNDARRLQEHGGGNTFKKEEHS